VAETPPSLQAPTSSLERQSSRSPEVEALRRNQKKERSKLVLWRRPVQTVHCFLWELLYEARRLTYGILQHKVKVTLFILLLVVYLASHYLDGPHKPFVLRLERKVLWWGYWVGLGILSSVGLGTGLHTFILYLGPYIASITIAAFDCESVDFPEPPYPLDIVCPEEPSLYPVTFWTVMSKVRWESFMWGAGTALGELPPYFMARAARLSGHEEEDPDYEELEAVLHSQRKDPLTRAKKAVHRLVERVGFFGILLCASIPNPLFDLAGITCGHFLIPFWTFFGATLIGKAVIKMHIQKVFVILTFSEHHVELMVDLIGKVPYIGPYVQAPFSDYLETQKLKLHRKASSPHEMRISLLSKIFGGFMFLMIVYFLVSIVHSMAQNFARRRDEAEVQKLVKSRKTR
jgi:membrane protein YqaA with SNARE-associated domain